MQLKKTSVNETITKQFLLLGDKLIKIGGYNSVNFPTLLYYPLATKMALCLHM